MYRSFRTRVPAAHCTHVVSRKSSRSRALRWALLAAWTACWCVAVVSRAAEEKPHPARPNILWLVSEDNDCFLGCFGDKLARTPTIDRLAAQGIAYDRCFAEPVCAPSRYTLITGTYAATCGPAEHMRAMGKIPAWMQGFPALLRKAGYFTSNNAKTDYNSPTSIPQAWCDYGKKAHWRHRPDPRQPFFAVFNHEVTHESCLFPEKETPLPFPATDAAKIRIPPYQPDTPEVRADWVRYYNHMGLLDNQLAAKLKDLADDGLADDTIVFYYSDNGGVLLRSKRFLEESGTHVPLVVYYPPKWRHLAPSAPGTRVGDPVGFIDFAPTVLSLGGVPIPNYMQGRAFAGPQRGPANEYAYCTRDRMDERYDMMRSVMDRRYLYVRNFRPDLPYVQPLQYQFRARAYQAWARLAAEGKLTAATAQFWGEKPTEELYDMQADPDSVHNLAGDPSHAATLARMRDALRQWMRRINDNGLIPEGSPLEGYEASRKPGAFPFDRALAMAELASDRNPARLAELIAGLDDASEPVRWWAAQGCTMLRAQAAPAATALRQRLADSSGAVQVAAAEALARLGQLAAALPALQKCLGKPPTPACGLQAANVLDRLGNDARPLLPAMKRVLRELPTMDTPAGPQKYPQHILDHAIGVLEGRIAPLAYPTPGT